jgi:hypothetical protein
MADRQSGGQSMKPKMAFDLIGLRHELFFIASDMDTCSRLQ